MTDGPFLSGLGQMETNSHLSGWEVTITNLGGHHHLCQCQGCAKLEFYHNPAFTQGPRFHSPCSSFTAELGGCDKSAPCVERRSEFAAVSPKSRKFANCPFAAFQPCPTCPHLLTNIQTCACMHPHIEHILTHARICHFLANALNLLIKNENHW